MSELCLPLQTITIYHLAFFIFLVFSKERGRNIFDLSLDPESMTGSHALPLVFLSLAHMPSVALLHYSGKAVW